MDDIVKELWEEFLMSEACSRFFQYAGDDDQEAQDFTKSEVYYQHTLTCRLAAEACEVYFKTKDLNRLLNELKSLGVENININL